MTYTGFEIAHRWRNSSIFRPMLSLAGGSVSTYYPYRRRLSDARWETQVDGLSRTSYVAPSLGLEVGLFKYMTAFAQLGTRFAGDVATPDAGRLSGIYRAAGLGFGKFK